MAKRRVDQTEMIEKETGIEKFSVTVPCTCGKKFKLRYDVTKKVKIRKTTCPNCNKDYNYILQQFLDNEQEIAKKAYEVFWRD
jgi:peptide subunit release factor RF-3